MTILKHILIVCFSLLVGCNQEPAQGEAHQLENANNPWFEEVALDWGIDFQYENGAKGNFHIAEVTGGAPALLDYDNDGDLDLYIVQGNSLPPEVPLERGNVLYENVDGYFVDRSEGSGANDKGYGIGVATGDYDGDGDVDIYVTNIGKNVLLRNDGGGHFTNVAKEAGVENDGFSACAAFGDLDGDGDLDLVVTQYLDLSRVTDRECFDAQSNRTYCNPTIYNAPVIDSLFINNGDGTFTDTTMQSGIGAVQGTGLGVIIAELTNDEYPDIFIANDAMPDRLWVNQGDGTFVDEGMSRNIAMDDTGVAKAGMGVSVVDIDQDGDSDVYVTNIYGESDSFYENKGDYFQDITRRRGLAAETRAYTRWGIVFEDFDNDGLIDLFESAGGVISGPIRYDESDPLAEPNLLFQQQEDGRFVAVKPKGGTEKLLIASSHGVAAGDIDGDGGVDLVIVNSNSPLTVLRNVVQNRGNWISLKVSNRNGADAIGATVVVQLDDGSLMYRQVKTSHGYASAHDPRIHFGLGSHTVSLINVRWPDGATATIHNPELSKVHDIHYVE